MTKEELTELTEDEILDLGTASEQTDGAPGIPAESASVISIPS